MTVPFIHFGKHTINLATVTHIKEDFDEMNSGDKIPFIVFYFVGEDSLKFSKTNWKREENPEYPQVKHWLDQVHKA